MNDHGSSLIEILVAVCLFSFVIVGFAQSTMSSHRTGDSSRFDAEATILAYDKLEQLRTRLSTDADLTDGTHLDAANPMRADGGANGIYRRSWQVVSDSPTLGMKRVEMRVSWASPLGTRSILLVTTIALL